MINHKKCFFISIVLFILFSFSLIISVEAQPSWVIWNKTFGGTDYDQAYSLVKTSDGGYVIVGRTWSFGAGGSDFWLIKTDGSGNMEWNKTYGGAGYDSASSLVQTFDGGYALAGQTESFGAGLGDFWLVKADEDGNMEWSRTYGGVGRDDPYSLVQTSDGGYVIVGRTWSFGAGDDDVWLVKTDGAGNMEWNQTYGGIRSESASSLVETSDGGFALAGSTTTFGFGNSDVWLVKTDGSGNKEWNRNYGGEVNDSAYSLIQMSDGGFILAGETESYGAGGSDVWFIWTNEQGVPEFPSWIILPLFLTITSIILIYRKRMKKVV